MHNLTIVNGEGHVVLCQHFDHSPEDDQILWEATLARLLFVEDRGALRELCARGDVIRPVGDKYVLARTVEQLIFMVTGSEEHDEITLRDVLTLLVTVVTAACEKKLTEAQIVKFHGKVCVCLQETVFEGTIMHSDLDTIMQMSKLKPVKLKV